MSRLTAPPGFIPIPPKGLMRRDQRRYLLLSLANYQSEESPRVERLLEYANRRWMNAL